MIEGAAGSLARGPVPDDIAEALDRARGRLGIFGGPIVYGDEVDSTNDLADRAASAGAREGAVFVAGAQRAGRGRLGRTWFSPPGAGLYVSVVLRPALGAGPGLTGMAPGFSSLTLVAGVALAEGLITATRLPVHIKWPNDLVIGRRKVCGILAEAAATDAGLRHVVVGFGINLREAAFPPELAARATSLEAESGRPVDRGLVLAESLASLAASYASFLDGRFASLLDRWRALSPSSVGAPVHCAGGPAGRDGTTAGVDQDGALLVDFNGRVEAVIAGEVVWR